MIYNSIEKLLQDCLISNKIITGEVGMIIHKITPFSEGEEYQLRFKDDNYKDIYLVSGIKVASPEDCLLNFIFDELKLKLDLIDAEEIFEIVGSFYYDIKSLDLLVEKANNFEGFQKNLFLNIINEVIEKYGKY